MACAAEAAAYGASKHLMGPGRAPGLLRRTVRPVGRITRLPGRTARPAASESPTPVAAATSGLVPHLIYALLKDASQPSAEMPYRPHRPC